MGLTSSVRTYKENKISINTRSRFENSTLHPTVFPYGFQAFAIRLSSRDEASIYICVSFDLISPFDFMS